MSILNNLTAKAKVGRADDVDYVIYHLNGSSTIAITRFADYALSLVENPDGIDRIKYHLLNGTQMQRNYCSLFFNRKGDWDIVKNAFLAGKIDAIQAFAR
jgi:hypothetical protein